MLFRLLRKYCLTLGMVLGLALPFLLHPVMTGAGMAQPRSLLASATTETSTTLTSTTSTDQSQTQGSLLNQQGSEAFRRGQHQEALQRWQAAADAYEQDQDQWGLYRVRLNQIQALQELGFYQRSLTQLEEIVVQLRSFQVTPDGLQPSRSTGELTQAQIAQLQMIALQRQGELLRQVGQLDEAQTALKEGLAIAQSSAQSIVKASPQPSHTSAEVGKLLFSLGNVAQARGETEQAIQQYQRVQAYELPHQSQVQLQLALMQAYLQSQDEIAAAQLWPNLQKEIAQLPDSHGKVYSQIKLAQFLLRLQQQKTQIAIPTASLTELLQTAAQTSRQLGDIQAQSYALGTLGKVYEQDQTWSEAQRWTQDAIELAESQHAPELLYQWYWQQGRIFEAQGQSEMAIASLQQSVQLLQSLRNDIVAAGSETQFSFRSDIEPLYRELVSLLLNHASRISEPARTGAPADPASKSERLTEAINVIDTLQKAELENFLQKACDQAQTEQVGKVDPNAAVIYPIVLGDRLEIVLQLPNQPLQQFTAPVTQTEFQTVLATYRRTLTTRSRRNFRPSAQRLYEWLIQPLEPSLHQNNIKTLVFVPDSRLNTVPMAALYSGQHFLLEDYRIATTPSLKLLGPKPLQTHQLSTLAAGISQGQNGFSRLVHVVDELQSIQGALPESKILLDDAFTIDSFRSQLQNLTAPIVHLATHGQFSSDAEQTYILAWDQTIPLQLFDQMLRQASQQIELLVLSACQTAVGDVKAALGITGVAVDVGVQSTVATLWSVDDRASSILMQKFYQHLSQPGITRAEALRQAQVELLQTKRYIHPFYWAPFILVGNWL